MNWNPDAHITDEVWSYAVANQVLVLEVQGQVLFNGNSVAKWTHEEGPWKIHELEKPWDMLHLRIKLSVSSTSKLEEVLPTSKAIPQLVARISSNRTRLRYATRGKPGELMAEWTAEHSRSNLRGKILIEPFATLAARVAPREGYANTSGAIIAVGAPLLILIDESDERGRGIQSQWSEFPEELSSALFRLVFEDVGDQIVPKIWFNKGHPVLKALIDYTGRKKIRAAVRDAVFRLLAPQIWIELALWAGDQELESDNKYSRLSSRIMSTLSRKLEVPQEEIHRLAGLDGKPRVDDLSSKLQHQLETAENVAALVTKLDLGEEK